MDLSGKVAVITGGASGIGAATALRLAELGATVVVADVDDARGDEVAGSLGEPHRYRHLDVGDLDAWKQLLDEVVTELGRLDIVHLNAGVMATAVGAPTVDDPADLLSEQGYRRVKTVNIDGVVFGIMAALPHLGGDGGDIVVTASEAGLTPLRLDPLYSLSKHAVVGLVRSLGPVLTPRSVRINCVCPGGIDTGIVPANLRSRGNFSPPSYIADVVVEILESGDTGTTWVAKGQDLGTWTIEPPQLVAPAAPGS